MHPLPHTPSWLSASLVKQRDNFYIIIIIIIGGGGGGRTCYKHRFHLHILVGYASNIRKASTIAVTDLETIVSTPSL
jgi:hypothetical protein